MAAFYLRLLFLAMSCPRSCTFAYGCHEVESIYTWQGLRCVNMMENVHAAHFRKKIRKNKQTFNFSSVTASFFVTFFMELHCFFADVEQECNLQDLYRTLTNKDYMAQFVTFLYPFPSPVLSFKKKSVSWGWNCDGTSYFCISDISHYNLPHCPKHFVSDNITQTLSLQWRRADI